MLFFNKRTNILSPYLLEQSKGFLEALGGKSNLREINACITRLRLVVKNKEKVNEEKLIQWGSKESIWVDNHQLHIILGKNADFIANLMNK